MENPINIVSNTSKLTPLSTRGSVPDAPPPLKATTGAWKIVLKYSKSVYVSVGTGDYFPVDALPNLRVVVRSPA